MRGFASMQNFRIHSSLKTQELLFSAIT